MRHLVLSLFVIAASSASAEGVFTLRAGYNLRYTANGRRFDTNRRAQTVTLVDSKGSWRRVCLGGSGEDCAGGKLWWVIKTALKPKSGEAPSSTPAASGARLLDTEDTKSAAACEGCRAGGKGLRGQTQPLAEVAASVDDDPKGLKLPHGKIFAKACDTFITAKGLGRWGKAMVDAAKRVAPDCMFDTNLFGPECPSYPKKKPHEKNAMLAVAFASIAQSESSCDENEQAQGTNDIADGMFMLEMHKKWRKAANRNKRWCRTGEEINTKDMTFQAECTISTIEDVICNQGRFLSSADGYWEKLAPDAAITKRMFRTARALKLCP